MRHARARVNISRYLSLDSCLYSFYLFIFHHVSFLASSYLHQEKRTVHHHHHQCHHCLFLLITSPLNALHNGCVLHTCVSLCIAQFTVLYTFRGDAPPYTWCTKGVVGTGVGVSVLVVQRKKERREAERKTKVKGRWCG